MPQKSGESEKCMKNKAEIPPMVQVDSHYDKKIVILLNENVIGKSYFNLFVVIRNNIVLTWFYLYNNYCEEYKKPLDAQCLISLLSLHFLFFFKLLQNTPLITSFIWKMHKLQTSVSRTSF